MRSTPYLTVIILFLPELTRPSEKLVDPSRRILLYTPHNILRPFVIQVFEEQMDVIGHYHISRHEKRPSLVKFKCLGEYAPSGGLSRRGVL